LEVFLSILVGLGLSAACGFRIFIPPLILSLAARSGHLELGQGFAWMGSNAAWIAFAVATVLEIAGYYIPWVDNLLDAIATPTAVVAGVLVSASAFTDVTPFLKWTLAILAGGGSAAVFQGITATARQISSLSTGGLGNPLLATVEAAGSALLSVLSVTLPLLAILVVAGLLYFGVRRLLFRRPARVT
jgi:Domain of unknown function (DUF4126)